MLASASQPRQTRMSLKNGWRLRVQQSNRWLGFSCSICLLQRITLFSISVHRNDVGDLGIGLDWWIWLYCCHCALLNIKILDCWMVTNIRQNAKIYSGQRWLARQMANGAQYVTKNCNVFCSLTRGIEADIIIRWFKIRFTLFPIFLPLCNNYTNIRNLKE